jgi:hypothetical protein
MKTSFIRIIISILTLGFASQGFSQGSNKMYLLLEDANGGPKMAYVAADGTFATPPLVRGSYSLTLVIKKCEVQTVLTEFDSRTQLTQFKIHFDKEVIRPREITDSKGKRFLPIRTIIPAMNGKDRYLPEINRKLGIIAIEEDSLPLTGKIEITTNGTPETPADWLQVK